jgi:hypothetical protein
MCCGGAAVKRGPNLSGNARNRPATLFNADAYYALGCAEPQLLRLSGFG